VRLVRAGDGSGALRIALRQVAEDLPKVEVPRQWYLPRGSYDDYLTLQAVFLQEEPEGDERSPVHRHLRRGPFGSAVVRADDGESSVRGPPEEVRRAFAVAVRVDGDR